MKFQYYNDTKRTIGIHSATYSHGATSDMASIKPGDICTFILPEGTFPWVKMWDYGGESGLQILVSPSKVDEE